MAHRLTILSVTVVLACGAISLPADAASQVRIKKSGDITLINSIEVADAVFYPVKKDGPPNSTSVTFEPAKDVTYNFQIRDSRGVPWRTLVGRTAAATTVAWDGRSKGGARVAPVAQYDATLVLIDNQNGLRSLTAEWTVEVVATVVVTGNASTPKSKPPAGRPTIPGWIDGLTLSNAVEERGVVYAGKRRPIDIASCLGLRRFGHRDFGYTTAYHRFKCSLRAADAHHYTASVTITSSTASPNPIAGRDEPSYLAADLADARKRLADATDSVQVIGTVTAKQRADIAAYLRPYKQAVANAEAALEPYRTKFSWKTTQVVRDF